MTTPGSKFCQPIEMVPGSANNIIILARAGKREHLEDLQKEKLRANHKNVRLDLWNVAAYLCTIYT